MSGLVVMGGVLMECYKMLHASDMRIEVDSLRRARADNVY